MQSKDKNDSVRLPDRYSEYLLAKRHIRGRSGQQILPFGKNDSQLITKGGEQASDAVISRTLTATDAKMHLDGTYIKQINQPKHSNDRVYSDKGISPTLNTMGGGNRQPFVAPVLTPNRLNKRQNGRRMKEDGEPSFTLTAQDKHGIYDGARIRKLTPVECEFLQAFSRDWTKKGINEKGEEVLISNSRRYKALGNAVTTSVIKAIISKMYK